VLLNLCKNNQLARSWISKNFSDGNLCCYSWICVARDWTSCCETNKL